MKEETESDPQKYSWLRMKSKEEDSESERKTLAGSIQRDVALWFSMASIGAAGIPAASLITAAMILESMGLPVTGLALIFAPERILDMFRTVTNITGDAVVAVVVASSEGELAEGANDKLLSNEAY